MTKAERKTLKELVKLHPIWKSKKASLKWWRNETGYMDVNIHKFCNIPIPHPGSDIQICCLYLMHIDYVNSKLRKPATLKLRSEVFETLKKYVEERGYQTCNDGSFPW